MARRISGVGRVTVSERRSTSPPSLSSPGAMPVRWQTLTASPDTDGSALLDLAERVARGAGDLLLAGIGDLRVDVTTKSSGTDMVSEMDRASEAFVVDGILAERPDDAILGEEGSSRAGT